MDTLILDAVKLFGAICLVCFLVAVIIVCFWTVVEFGYNAIARSKSILFCVKCYWIYRHEYGKATQIQDMIDKAEAKAKEV